VGRKSTQTNSGWIKSGAVVRVLLSILCLETLYIVSNIFSRVLICDDLRVSLSSLQTDYDRSQLVLKTVSLSCNESEYQECIQNVETLKAEQLAYRTTQYKRMSLQQEEMFQCQNDLRAAKLLESQRQHQREQKHLEQQEHDQRDNSGPHAHAEPEAVGSDAVKSSKSADSETPQVASPTLAVPAVAEDGDDPPPWLLIAVPTVPRKAKRGSVDYLTGTLRALVSHLPTVSLDPLSQRIKIVVMNNKPGAHEPFRRSREFYEGSQWASYFDFVVSSFFVGRVGLPVLSLRLVCVLCDCRGWIGYFSILKY